MNQFLHALEKIGHGAKVVGKDALKVAEVAAPVAAQVFAPELSPLLQRVMTMGPDIINPKGLIGNYFNFAVDGGNMNPLEAMAVMMILGVLNTTVKNPQHKAALQTHLLGLADDIYIVYGIPPAAHSLPSSPSSPTV